MKIATGSEHKDRHREAPESKSSGMAGARPAQLSKQLKLQEDADCCQAVKQLKSLQSLMNRGGLRQPNKPLQLQPVVQRHHLYGRTTLDDGTLSDIEIYVVKKKSNDKVVYVGQTCDQVGYKARFQQHLKSGYHNNWSENTHYVERKEAGNWTLLEAMIAEQYWIDHYGFGNLENNINALTRATWIKYRDDSVTTPNFKGQYGPKN